MSTDVFNRSLTVNQKLLYFSGAWLLACFVLFDAITKFIDTLAYLKAVSLPENFNFLSLALNQGFVATSVKILAILIASISFAIIYSYLARRVSLSDKISLSIACALVLVVGLPVVILYVASIIGGWDYSLGSLFAALLEAVMYDSVVMWSTLVQLAIVVFGALLGFFLGKRLTARLPEEKGRLLGVKWYHFFWLAPALVVYIQSLLYLAYLTVSAVVEFLARLNILEELAAKQGESSLQGLVFSLFVYYGVGYLVVRLGVLQAQALNKQSKMQTWKKLCIGILFALIIPVLILMFTVVGNYA